MSRLVAFATLLLLTSCILVGDFGDFWRDGTIDPALEGTWNVVETNGKKPDRQEQVSFLRSEQFYVIDSSDENFGKGKKAGEYQHARSVKGEQNHFLMVKLGGADGKEIGMFFRYFTYQGKIWLYYPSEAGLQQIIKSSEPASSNVILEKNKEHGGLLHVQVLNQPLFDCIAGLGDDGWTLQAVLEKAK